MIVAAVHRVARGTKKTGVVRSAERALTPSLMNVPDTTTAAWVAAAVVAAAGVAAAVVATAVVATAGVVVTCVAAATSPSASRTMHSRSTLHEAQRFSAAAHTRAAIAEEACAVDRAERSAPSLIDSRRRLQRSCIVPAMLDRPGRVSLVLVRLLQVRARDIQATCDIRECVSSAMLIHFTGCLRQTLGGFLGDDLTNFTGCLRQAPGGFLGDDLTNPTASSQARLCGANHEEATGAENRSNDLHRN